MRLYEDTHTEFKTAYTEDIKKTVVVFGNIDGGTIPYRTGRRWFLQI